MDIKAKKLKRSSQSEMRAVLTSAKLLVDARAAVGNKIKHKTAKPAGVLTKVKFGSVTVKVLAPSNAVVKQNIVAGQMALSRAKIKILRPGVTISSAKGIPLFHADPEQPEMLIRELDGKVQRGRFVDGKFKAAR